MDLNAEPSPGTWPRCPVLWKSAVGVHCSVHVFRRQASILCQLIFNESSIGLFVHVTNLIATEINLEFSGTLGFDATTFSFSCCATLQHCIENEGMPLADGNHGPKNFPWGFNGSRESLGTNLSPQMQLYLYFSCGFLLQVKYSVHWMQH